MTIKSPPLQPGLFTPAAEARAEEAGASLEVLPSGVARLTLGAASEKVIVLTTAVMERLDTLLAEVRADGAIKGLIIRSALPDMFIAGADIDEIEAIVDPGEGEGKARRGQQVLQRIADLAIPTAAAIDGPCLGGGCELALACDFRIASDGPKVQIGLPEVRLGIIPGFGGTQRLPALIGTGPALDLILSGRMIDARKARRLGLVDRVVPREQLDAEAERMLAAAFGRVSSVRSPDGHRRDWRRTSGKVPARRRWLRAVVESPPALWIAQRTARRRLAGKVDPEQYPAPYRALDAVIMGRRVGIARGLDFEARCLGDLIVSRTSKSLVFLFRATTAAKSDPGIAGAVPPLRAIAKVGVLGAGQMGAGIAGACAAAGTLVRLRDVSWEALAKGIGTVAGGIARDQKRGKIDAREAARRRGAIAGTTDWSGFRAADLVVEAVIERLDVKRDVFARLEDLCSRDAILASNTSSIPIAEIAAMARRPERFVGLHFFNPVDRMPLVEVIATKATDRAVTASAVAFAKRLGKTPIVVRDAPGFLVNRLLMPYLGEALILFEEGARADVVDAQVREFGMPMGPFELLDTIGLDVAQHVARVLSHAFGDRMPPPTALEAITASGKLGKKGGEGFYLYDAKGAKRGVNREASRIASASKRPRESEIGGRTAGRLTEMQERLILPMVNEAAIVLGEGIVRTPLDVDLGMVMGTGFPPFRGGLLRFADSAGAANLVERLELLAAKHGRRFAPAEYLKDLARAGRGFHPAA